MPDYNSPLSFCIGCCNNIQYLKLAIRSIRTYSYWKKAPLIIFAENCDKDDTYQWLLENQEKYDINWFKEDNIESEIKGIGGGMNFCAKKVQTEYIMFLHADMFVSKNWDLNALKVSQKYDCPSWVSSQRFQPNLFKENSRPGTLVFPYEEFGYKYNDFQEDYFIQYAAEFSKLNPDIEIEKGEGVSGLIKKKDWDFIGGCDLLFNPAYFDDKDLFLRMQLAGYKFILTSNSVVFHFGSRSDKSNFPDDEIKRSERSKFYEQRSGQRFFEKWGFWPVHNEYQFDVIPSHIDTTKLQHLIRI
jgi:GT2 family glycosyltransferase